MMRFCLVGLALMGFFTGCGSVRAAVGAGEDCGVTAYKQHSPDDSSYEADEYLDLALDEARRRAGEADLEVRVLGQDGDCADRTDDHRDDRVNFYVEDGEVTKAARY